MLTKLTTMKYINKRILTLALLLCAQSLFAQRTVEYTNWQLWRSSNDEAREILTKAKADGFDAVVFSLTPLYNASNRPQTRDGEGATFTSGNLGQIDTVTDQWLNNRKAHIDIAQSVGLKVSFLPLWIDNYVNNIYRASGRNIDGFNLRVRSYCEKLGRKGLFSHPAVKTVVFGGDFQAPKDITELATLDAWRQCKQFTGNKRIGYHTGGHPDVTTMLSQNAIGLIIELWQQSGHTNRSPEYRLEFARNAFGGTGVEIVWGESIYHNIDINAFHPDPAERGDCATWERVRDSIEGVLPLSYVVNYVAGTNESHQNTDGSNDVNHEPWPCFSGLTASQALGTPGIRSIVYLWKGDQEETEDDLLPNPMRLIRLVQDGDQYRVESKGAPVYVEGRRLDNQNPLFRSDLTSNIGAFSIPDGPHVRLVTTDGGTEFTDFTLAEIGEEAPPPTGATVMFELLSNGTWRRVD